ncbi:hypothetical protein GCM10009831_33050 [Dietzia cercidiphylli]|uniref:Uncharacterized protein n=1 Tax=Dietzia cercidiphylli TaxID=498199 RepID=A0ABP4V9I0_9ACTN
MSGAAGRGNSAAVIGASRVLRELLPGGARIGVSYDSVGDGRARTVAQCPLVGAPGGKTPGAL